MKGTLYLIPNLLGDTPINQVIPAYNSDIIRQINYFIVENIRTARRFLKRIDPHIDIDRIQFFELNQHTDIHSIPSLLLPLQNGYDMGIISEAGCPAVADPGSAIVALAHEKQIKVIPLVGPSSIILALMASGFNGQSFAFAGYLPIEKEQRKKYLSLIENRIYTENQTQIFIETPYRNQKIMQDLVKYCRVSTRLCIAFNLTEPSERIKTLSIGQWRKEMPDLEKRPCIFLLYK